MQDDLEEVHLLVVLYMLDDLVVVHCRLMVVGLFRRLVVRQLNLLVVLFLLEVHQLLVYLLVDLLVSMPYFRFSFASHQL
jgi:hypothetical protein